MLFTASTNKLLLAYRPPLTKEFVMYRAPKGKPFVLVFD